MKTRNLIFILGDQLSPSISSLNSADKKQDQILMVEVHEEATYVRHHKKKIAFIFAAMRHFAENLQKNDWRVEYIKLDAKNNSGSFTDELKRAVKKYKPEQIVVTEPGEWRVKEAIGGWSDLLDLPVDVRSDDRFLADHETFQSWAKGKKQLRMEYFYREMRKETGLLMEGDAPEGGKWNYDAQNRKPAKSDLDMPSPKKFKPNKTTKEVIDLVGARFDNHFGDLKPFWFAVTAKQAEQALDHFIEHALPRFGDYQDAMLRDERFLYHSVISLYIHVGLLDPLDVCKRAEKAYYSDHAPLNAVEGFIRQIIGWREFIRGIYWLKMPDYVEENFFEAKRDLPDFYWTGETDMECIKQTVLQTKEEAYAHHIQRLMVTGNFAMLIGAHPKQVHEWYLSVYADAYEWVELPNTLGMSQFADGGVLGSKPYASSGNYIHKMSDYCGSCAYDVKTKTGDKACPFNPLYWDFLARNEDKLRGNPRLNQIYSTWDRMGDEKKKDYIDSAEQFLKTLA